MFDHNTIIESALAFAKSSDTAALSGLSSYDFQNALMAHAEATKRPNQAVGHQLVKLSRGGDEITTALANAVNAAEAGESQLSLDERAALLGKSIAGEREPEGRKEHGSAAHVEAILDDLAKAKQRDGETFEQCYARLLKDDQTFRDGYELFVEKRG